MIFYNAEEVFTLAVDVEGSAAVVFDIRLRAQEVGQLFLGSGCDVLVFLEFRHAGLARFGHVLGVSAVMR
ncbi:hypothetical protein GCM10022382_16780 [Microbacterium invictum]